MQARKSASQFSNFNQLHTQASEVMRTPALLQSLSKQELLTHVLSGLEAYLAYMQGAQTAPSIQAQLQSEWQDNGTTWSVYPGAGDDEVIASWGADRVQGGAGNDQLTPKLLPKTCKRRNEKRYQLSSCSRTEYGGYSPIYLTNWVTLSTPDAGADGGDIHHGGFLGFLHDKYSSSPRGACVGSYRKNSGLMRSRCHGAWLGKWTPSQSRTATAPGACGHSHHSKDQA